MNNDSFKDYYEILQVDRNATQEEVAVAYKSLAKKYHPDLNFNNLDEANEKMKTINEAYNILNNVESRRRYNLTYDSHMRNNINSSSITNNYNSYVTRKDTKEDDIRVSSFFKFKKRSIVIVSIIALFLIYMVAEKILISNDYTSNGRAQKGIDTSIKQTDRVRDNSDNNHYNNPKDHSRKHAKEASIDNDRQTNDMP